MAWDELAPVAYPAEVQEGSAITYGGGKVWGIFPDPSDSLWSYFECYDPNAQGGPDWEYLSQEFFITNSAITYQWQYGGEVLVVGNEFGEEGESYIYCYDVADSSWDEDEISEFNLGPGASVAFRPAPGYYGTYVAGWMYCLVGGGDEFWCYSLPGPGDVTVDGICPGETSLIADNTPTFIWSPVQGAQKYKLTISRFPNMSFPVLVDSLDGTTYDVTQALDNSVYYWQSASRQGYTWTTSTVHSFTLEGGWTQRASLPVDATYGASLAYEKDFYSGGECMVALAGGSYQYLSIYHINTDSWDDSITTPKAQDVGSAIVTHEAATSTPPDWQGPWAEFGEGHDDLYYHTNDKPGWYDYNELPQYLGAGASMAYGIESGTHYLYLIVGEDANGPRNSFWRQELPTSGGGGQAHSTRLTSLTARPLCVAEGITVEYQLSIPARVRASVFDAVGRQVSTLDAGSQQPGTHQLSWSRDNEGRRLSAGTYFVLLDAGAEQARLKAVVR